MSLSSHLRSVRASRYDDIAREEAAIKELEALYHSLERFKVNVERTTGEFEAINRRKQDALADLHPIKKDCKTAERYEAGMLVVLDGIGVQIVLMAFVQLQAMIVAKQTEYKVQIEVHRACIAALRLQIIELDAEIALAEAAEEAAREAEAAARSAVKTVTGVVTDTIENVKKQF